MVTENASGMAWNWEMLGCKKGKKAHARALEGTNMQKHFADHRIVD
jgi:hypothetical protein